ncbi:hypothetical protein AB0I00_25435 [Streptomyces sp. NPDC050803]|uniref:hypothetical protein n=1 Tax=unclassified Streptomyces TaxID=2593676 RepID=UPI0034140304
MPVHAPNRPVCRNCAGFCAASVTTGARHRDGSRVTLRVVCPVCQGTGRSLPARSAQAGR